MGHFDFVKNIALSKNLDIAFNHVVTLLSLSEDKNYDQFERSSFYKTIIIYTASIIEALLCDLITRVCCEGDLTIKEWKIENRKVLYKVDADHQIIAGDYIRKSIKIKPDKMNLGIILEVLRKNKLISPKLSSEIDDVRKLRNDQHFGTHEIVKEYTKANLEFVFSVAREVKEISKITYEGLT